MATSAGAASYTYDKDGFLTGKTVAEATTGYQYYSRGELLQVDLPRGDVVTYSHDPLGRRIAKKRNGTAVEKYLWQGRTRLLAVYDGSGALTARFEYADGRLPVAMTKGSTRYFLVYDQVGSLRAVLDSSGGIVKIVDYDSFGNVIAESNSAFTVPFGFAGGLFDSDTGLNRFGYRDYAADVGRWTTKDPIGFEGGDTDLYGYVVGDPVNGVDVNGLQMVMLGTLPFPLPMSLSPPGSGGKKERKGKPLSCPVPNSGDSDPNDPDDDNYKPNKNRDDDSHGGGKSQVDSVAKRAGMTDKQRGKFGKYIEGYKYELGIRGNFNIYYRQL